MISLQFHQILLTGLLPVFSTLVAGVARQDRAPAWLNDFISFVTPLGAGVVNTVASGAPANGNGLLFLAVSALMANLSHTPFLFNIQQELQSRVLSLGVKPAQIQQFEQATIAHMPQMEALLIQLIDEVRGSRVQPMAAQNTPGLYVAPGGSGAPVQINAGGTPLAQPPAGWQNTNAPVPQQAFPPLNWTGLELPSVKP